MKFRLILNLEGYETKRRYDTLLLGRGKTRTDISHTDSDRYGLWACKGGVPVEKIDSWIEGGKGSYTFIHGFLDCDDFTLTANRGSINNTPTEKTDIIKNKLKELFATKKFNDSINERTEIERFENQLQSIKEDGDNLKKRSTLAKQKKRIILPNGDVFFEPGKRSTGYSESETMVLLLQLVAKYPDLLSFKLLDYDTIKGIDFVVEHQSGPKYIELKGTLQKSINHPFRHIFKFICYELGVTENDQIEDIEEFRAKLVKNADDVFETFDSNYKQKTYTSYILQPKSATISSMEIVELKSLLIQVLGAKIV